MATASIQPSVSRQLWLSPNGQVNSKAQQFTYTPNGTKWNVKATDCHSNSCFSFGSFSANRHVSKIQKQLSRNGITPQVQNHSNLQALYSGKNGTKIKDTIRMTFDVDKPTIKLQKAPKFKLFIATSENKTAYHFCPTISCPITGKQLHTKDAIQLRVSKGQNEQWITCSREGARKLILNYSPSVAEIAIHSTDDLSSDSVRPVTSENIGGSLWFLAYKNRFQTKWFFC
ncbi:hypothetical protein D5R81_04305 [Parashewanella spongiae]|uniref:Uncharacterized protein n=1 Tax=Parashewanella spongiae TaxID=342950 RepID=A0A3A6U3G7_9GAMM|nr:hypothetical protein [Parashewanella spongiae]MCL1077522.1 hypothetical protein [Parashewanella spongiae]RJY18621.1 hypothetical protein D5R81_04305 [Parashewanella spongiae]